MHVEERCDRRSHGLRSILPLLVLALLTASCATNRAPRKWHSPAIDAQQEGYGSWIEVTIAGVKGGPTYLGELIAVEADTLYVLDTSALHAIPTPTITRAELFAYDANWGLLAAWTTIGAFGSLSHGYLGTLSIPTWGLIGSISSATQSHMPLYVWPDDPWSEFSPFARFPVGLPEVVRERRVVLKVKR